jgi:hypothetical protein
LRQRQRSKPVPLCRPCHDGTSANDW